MKRRRAKEEEAKPAMFPFLDVLICTAGTLIILLIVIASQAWQQAVQAEDDVEEKAPPAVVVNVEDAPETWVNRAKQADENRTQVASVVSGRRAELGYLEQALRDQQTRIIELDAAVKAGLALSSATDEQFAGTEAELGRLERSLAESQEHLKELRQANKERKKTFSIIPYEGANGTTRIPIYIECRADRVIVHPGGVELGSDDFLFSDDAGNPLATLLRATREEMVTSRSTTANEEPYPLILIRPDGIDSYYAVRQSLQGWTTEFGYEMIDKDWKLKFPVQDPKLFEIQQRALAESRLRQQALAVAFKRRSKRSGNFVAAPRAGIVNESGAGGTAVGTSRNDAEQTGDAFGEPGFGNGGGNGNSGPGGLNARGAGSIAGQSPQGFGGSQVAGSPGLAAGGRDYAGTGGDGTGGTGMGQHGTGRDIAGGDGSGGNGMRPNSVGDANAEIPGSPNTGHYAGGGNSKYADGKNTGAGNAPIGRESNDGAPNNGQFGGPNRRGSEKAGGFRTGPNNAAGSSTGQADAPGAGQGGVQGDASASTAANGQAGGSSGAGGGSGGPDSGQPSQFGSPSMDLPPKEELGGLAKKRGRDWGLRYAEPAATPLTRPVRIVCERDRLMIMTADRNQAPRQIILTATTQDSVDPLVTAVWDEIKGWGIAGKGMYWKPILTFDVRPDGEARFKDFEQLLIGSGLEVKRSAAAQQATLPGRNGGRR